jgi:hypothetical protein
MEDTGAPKPSPFLPAGAATVVPVKRRLTGQVLAQHAPIRLRQRRLPASRPSALHQSPLGSLTSLCRGNDIVAAPDNALKPIEICDRWLPKRDR